MVCCNINIVNKNSSMSINVAVPPIFILMMVNQQWEQTMKKHRKYMFVEMKIRKEGSLPIASH